MEPEYINCGQCRVIPAELSEYAVKTCRLCGQCDECLNEAGYCAPCNDKLFASKEEAIAV